MRETVKIVYSAERFITEISNCLHTELIIFILFIAKTMVLSIEMYLNKLHHLTVHIYVVILKFMTFQMPMTS